MKHIILSIIVSISLQQYCHDENGKKTQYFSIFKFPNSVQQEEGKFYSFFTANNSKMTIMSHNVDHQDSLLYKTFDNATDGYIFAWNDEFPSGKSHGSNAHSKGIIYYNPDTDSGFFISHSTPGFPAINDDGSIDTTLSGQKNIYGQQFLLFRDYFCMTLSGIEIDELTKGILIIRPLVYFNTMNQDGVVPQKYKNILTLVNKKINQRWSNQDFLVTKIGNYQAFFKSPRFPTQIFTMINDFYKSGSTVETWGRPYEADTETIKNAERIQIEDFSWSSSADHSKWLVMNDVEVVCFGDMNYMESQEKRGGSFHCLEDTEAYNYMRRMIGKEDD